jgi:DNA-binding response OmpR family regulator
MIPQARMSDELAAFRGREVLVVDDDEDFRAIVSGHLVRAGLDVVELGDAEQAFERCMFRVPALILMDMWMPGRTGIQACALLRRSKATGDVPILLMSAQWRDEAQLCRAIDAGANDVLAKERQGFELIARVRALLTLDDVRRKLSTSEQKLDQLRSFLAICAGCRQVRNEDGQWEDIALYLSRITDRDLTHGICPQCRDRLYGASLGEASPRGPLG